MKILLYKYRNWPRDNCRRILSFYHHNNTKHLIIIIIIIIIICNYFNADSDGPFSNLFSSSVCIYFCFFVSSVLSFSFFLYFFSVISFHPPWIRTRYSIQQQYQYCVGDVVVVRLWETQSPFICPENCLLFLVALFLSQSRVRGSVNVKWYGICRKHKTNLLQQGVWDWVREMHVTLCNETTPTDRSTVGSLVCIQV
jgi:hypothetical protein